MTQRLPCQVCGRQLVPLKDGTARPHRHHRSYSGRCQGSGYRMARWEVGQRLRHHAGSVWEVIEDRGGRYGDYLIRCVASSPWPKSEQAGNETVTHGEYMHRHGWTPSVWAEIADIGQTEKVA